MRLGANRQEAQDDAQLAVQVLCRSKLGGWQFETRQGGHAYEMQLEVERAEGHGEYSQRSGFGLSPTVGSRELSYFGQLHPT